MSQAIRQKKRYTHTMAINDRAHITHSTTSDKFYAARLNKTGFETHFYVSVYLVQRQALRSGSIDWPVRERLRGENHGQ